MAPDSPAAQASLANRRRTAIWSAAVLAGVLASIAFFLWQILLNELVYAQGPWTTTRWLASIALGESVMHAPIGFDLRIVSTAVVVNVGLSVVYACMLAPLLNRVHMLPAVAMGIAFGAILFAINLLAFSAALFPWMQGMKTPVTFVGHLVFGFVIAYTYKMAQRGQRKGIDLPQAEKETHTGTDHPR